MNEWNFAFEQFQKTADASERSKILYGLSGASEPWILNRFGFKWLSEVNCYLLSHCNGSNEPPIKRCQQRIIQQRGKRPV